MAKGSLEGLGELKLKELEVFQAAARAQSIREVARRMKSTPGQISKIIKNIERKVQARLFLRSSSGVVLSESGTQMLGNCEAILANAYQMESIHRKDNKRVLGIGSTPFLVTYLVATRIVELFESRPEYNLRFHDFAPDQMVNSGLRGAFEIAVHFGKVDWPATWISKRVGVIEWKLCARAGHPLKKNPSREEVLRYPFVFPTYWTSEGLQKGNDNFEIPISQRILGYETSTADAAVPIILGTNQLGFLPGPLVQPLVASKVLKTIQMKGAKKITRDLYVSAKTDVIKASVYEAICTKLAEA